MADLSDDPDAIQELLQEKRRIAVVGASDNPERDSRRIYTYLRGQGYDVLPVNPVYDEVAGDAAVDDLAAAADHWGAPPDLVDVFRAPEKVMPVVDEAMEVGAPAIWFQLGVVNREAIGKALEAGMDVVVDRCIYVEHSRLLA